MSRDYESMVKDANAAAAEKAAAQKARGARAYNDNDLGRIVKFRQVGNEYKPIVVLRDTVDQFYEQEVEWAPLRGSQELFLNAPETEVLYEGTRGPGKTLTLLMDFTQHVGQGYGGDWKGVLFRQTYPQLADVIQMSKKWFKRLWPDAFFNEIKTFWQWPTGEVLYFRPFATPASYWDFHGHCVPYGEVLTPAGWKDISQCKVGDVAYSVSPTGELIEDRIDVVTRERFVGNLATADTHFSHMTMTPEHRVMVRRDGGVVGKPQNQLVQGDKIARTVSWQGRAWSVVALPIAKLRTSRMKCQPTRFSAEDFFEFIGWYVSEGSVCQTPARNKRVVTISQYYEPKKSAIRALLTRMGLDFREDAKGFYFSHAEFWEFLQPLGGSYEKRIPEWMKGATVDLLQRLLFAAIDGDGHWYDERRVTCQYESMSAQLRDDIAELAVKCGFAVKQGIDAVNIHTGKADFTYRGNGTWDEIAFDGDVYCIGLHRHHAFVIRQHGYVWVSHNSYPWIGWEELTSWPDPDCFKSMFTCSRSVIKNMPRKIRATTNPYGIGHNWVQARYQLYNWPEKGKVLAPLIVDSVDEKGVPEPPRRAIHGHLQENSILMHTDPGYVSRIKAGARNESELNAWLYGSWDIAAGGMFDDIWYSHKDTIVCPDFEVPSSWRLMRAYDHGSSKPWAVGYYAESDGTDLEFPDGSVRSTVRGDLFRVGEVYGWQNNQPNVGSRDLVIDIKKKIVAYEENRGWRDIQNNKCRVRRGPADTSIFDDNNGVCISDDFEKPFTVNGYRVRGIMWERADKGPGSREQGWEQMRKRLKATMRPDGGYREIPGLFICRNCVQWLRTVPTLPRDEKKIDDVDSDAEDHIGDENRYMLRFDRGTLKSGRR